MTDSHAEITVTQPALTEQPERLDLRSHDIVSDKQAVIIRLFPEVRTEGEKIDFDRLKRVLGEVVDPGKERYVMNWAGKADCFKTIQRPSLGTLLPCRDQSLEFDAAENLIIEGDNLEVLKLLQKSYLGKVKLIFIDPPYNTGNDFIYPDNFSESLQTYLEYTGQVDSEGRKFSTNTESDGRFHSKWLNMMYPRMYLARNLLSEDGVACICIDDAEVDNLKKLCNEMFGEENFVAQLVWEKGRKNDARRFSVGHEYILIFARNLSLIEEVVAPWREPKAGIDEVVAKYQELKKIHGKNYPEISAGLIEFYKSLDEGHPAKKYSRSRFVDARGIWRDNNIGWPGGGGPTYDLIHPVTKKPCKVPDDGWRFVETTMKEKVKDGYIQFREDHTQSPFLKSYLYVDDDAVASEEDNPGDKQQVMGSVFYRHTQPASDVVKELFGEKIFENPKDHEIIAKLIRYCAGKNDIILDFFAGSGTTAHSVIDLNEADGGNRKFILVQLPEPTERKDFPTISSITRERVRRVFKKLDRRQTRLQLNSETKRTQGFRSFKLGRSHFRVWDSTSLMHVESTEQTAALTRQLELHISHVQTESQSEQLLYELLLKSGFPLTTQVEEIKNDNATIYSVSDGAMLVCLERTLSADLLRTIAARKPERVIVLDDGFSGNDQLKTNAVQIMKSKGVTSFRTV
jgi:adenine-specific DNA-methyltransferase